MPSLPMARRAFAAALLISSAALAAPPAPLKSLVGELKPAAPGADLMFVVAGDSRPTGRLAPLPRTVPAIFAEVGLIRPDLVVWTGDTVYGYCDSAEELRAEHQAFVAAAQAGGVPVFNTTGNHEIHTPQTCPGRPAESLCAGDCAFAQFRGLYGWEYGSFDTAGAHFVLLSTDLPGHEDEIVGEQMAWLKADLEAHKSARAIFVFTHTEFYSAPQMDKDAVHGHEAIKNVPELNALFHRYPVKAVFSGHEHVYSHEVHDGIDYFVAGGGGAPLYAPPEHGGFSHYLVVRLHDGKVSSETIGPGRLFTQAVPAGPGETRLWVVNGNDSDLPLRGIEAALPAGADCKGLSATAEVPYRARTAPEVTIAACADGKARLEADATRRRSVLVTVKAAAPESKPGG